MGMASITHQAAPFPKHRAACFGGNEVLPPYAHRCSTPVEGDDDQPSGEAGFDDCVGRRTDERGTGDDTLGFTGLSVALTLGELPREDDVIEREDRQVVIIKLFGCAG